LISLRAARRANWRRIRILALSAVFLLLASLLIYSVVFMPEKTPVIGVTTDYAWPLPPNAWSREDLERLDEDLGRHTLQVMDDSTAWTSRQRGLDQLDRQLKRFARRPPRCGVLVVYLSMHGVVDGAGQPCLMPAGASPLASETWLTLDELLAHVKAAQLPESLKVVLLLDSNRQLVNWNIGLLYNSFAERLPEVVAKAEMPNLVVLSSAGLGQRGWASADLKGSAFGQYLRLGLAGDADVQKNGGDGNDRVSLHELYRYLQHRVDAWVQRNRADRQTPMMCPPDAADFELCWSLNRRALRRLIVRTGDVQRPPSSVTSAELTRLWQRRDQLAVNDPHRYDPLAWRDIEHQLLWLELAVDGGQAYARAAQRTYEELDRTLGEIEGRAVDARTATSAFTRANVFSGRAMPSPTAARLHSLALAEYFGTLDARTADQIRGRLTVAEPFSTWKDEFTATLTGRDVEMDAFSEVLLLRMLHCYDVGRRWQDSEIVAEAVNMHDRGERVAALRSALNLPGDVRAHACMRPLLDRADETRRSAEDLLFAGKASGMVSEDVFSEVRRVFDQSEEAMMVITAAFSTRDRAWSEMPYLLQWLTRPVPLKFDSEALDRRITKKLSPLLDRSRLLDEALQREVRRPEDVVQMADACAEHANAVDGLLAELKSSLEEECRSLIDNEDVTPQGLRGLDAALGVPLISWQLRDRMRDRRAAISEELYGAHGGAWVDKVPARGADAGAVDEGIGSPGPQEAQRPTVTYLERLAQEWPTHPAVAFVGADTLAEVRAAAKSDTAGNEVAGFSQRLARQGSRLRKCLFAAARVRDAEAPRSREPLDAATLLNEIHAPRTPMAETERAVRRLASFWFPEPAEDPVHRLRRLRLQELLLWHARRALDDFWGPVDSGERPFFVVAAKDHITASRSVAEYDASDRWRASQIESLITRRGRAARTGLATTAADIFMIDERETVSTRVVVRGDENGTAGWLPPGHATVFLRDAQGILPDTVRTVRLPLPTASGGFPSEAFDISITGQCLLGRGPVLEAVTLFRGAEFTAPLLLRVPGGMTVDFRRHTVDVSRITLRGHRRKRASLVFILDCSNSMKELMEVEAPGKGLRASRVARLDIAKDALRSMLARLVERGDARLGVRFYGHRVGWSTVETKRLLRQSGYDGVIPPELQPYEDVELILPLGRFDSVAAGLVSDRMKSVEPWGESPLYLALRRALRDFDKDDENTEKSIIVITDGVNYQYNAPALVAPRREDVESEYAGRDVSIHIVGFGIPKAEGELARREFESLARQTGGSFVSATNAPSLIRSIEAVLRKNEYRIVDDIGGELARGQINSTLEIRPKPGTHLQCVVEMESLREDIELEGGEALELVIGRDGRRIESVILAKGRPKFARLLTGTQPQPTGYRVGVHQPLWTDEGVVFPISFQREDRGVAARPAEVWIEITPKVPNEDQPRGTYVFYDVNFEPGQPAPYLRWLARKWPKEASKAQVRVWCRPEVTESDQSVSIPSVANLPPPTGGGFTIDALPGVSYQIRTIGEWASGGPFQVGVVQRHTSDCAINALKAELTPPPQRIVHQFDGQNGIVLHTFQYDAGDERPAEPPEIRFTTRRRLLTEAWHLERPVDVPVANRGNLIEPWTDPHVDLLPLEPPTIEE